jgi:nucleoid-associated protein YgaU
MYRYAKVAAILGLSLVLLNCPTTPKKVDTVAAPAFSPAEGVYATPQAVTLSTATEGAEIRYTTDGSAPTPTSGTLYKAGFTVSASVTVRAIAYKNGLNDSPVSSASYTIAGSVASVQFSPAAGSFDAPVSVTLSTGTPGAEIWYTTDGSEPAPSKGSRYSDPVRIAETATIKAVATKQSWTSSPIASARYIVSVAAGVLPITDEEIGEARNAIARAKEADADYYDPENFTAAQRLLDEALDARSADPEGARSFLASSKGKADLSFDNAVQRAAADMAKRMEAAQRKLLAMEADKFLPGDYESAVAPIAESQDLYSQGSYADARAAAYKALRGMTDLANRLETRLGWVRQLKRETEQYMKEAEDTGAYAYAPEQKEKVSGLYLKGVDSYQGYALDDAEEYFGAAREAARDTLRMAREKRENRQADERAKAEALQLDVMKALQEASKLTIVTEDGTVIEPQNWSEEDFLKEIERMEQEERDANPGGQSMLLPASGATVVMADESSENLLKQAKELWTLGIREKAQGNYEKAQDYFNEALRYIEIYKSYAVKGVYTVRLIPERRDCLWRISEYPDIYGDPYLWPKIWRRNRKLIQNPDLIQPGWQLVIPPQ